jgi:hypothetical protein
MCILADMNSFSLKPSYLFNDGAEMVSEEFLSLQAGEHVHLGGYELLLCSVVSLLCLQEILNKKENLQNVSHKYLCRDSLQSLSFPSFYQCSGLADP